MLNRLETFVNNMNRSSSITEKKSVLALVKDDEDLKKLLVYTYSPYLKYGVTSKNILKYTLSDFLGKDMFQGTLFDLLDQLAARKLTGHKAIAAVHSFLYQHGHDDLILNIIDKDLKTRAGATLINSIIPGLIPTFEVALANSYADIDPKKINVFDGSWFTSRKLDGVRCICMTDSEGEPTFFTREGNEINSLTVLKNIIRDYKIANTVFDGELCLLNELGDEDFQGIVSEFRRKDHTIEHPAYCIFDMLTREEFDNQTSERLYSQRYFALREFFYHNVMVGNLRLVPQVGLYNERGLEALREQAADLGWEGVMLRKDAPYKGKRSNDLLKVKAFKDDEFEVIDLELGEFRAVVQGKEVILNPVMTNLVVGLVVDGKVYRVGVGTGFSIEDRKLYAANPKLIVGKRVTVKYFDITKNKAGDFSLRFPTFKAIRDFE